MFAQNFTSVRGQLLLACQWEMWHEKQSAKRSLKNYGTPYLKYKTRSAVDTLYVIELRGQIGRLKVHHLAIRAPSTLFVEALEVRKLRSSVTRAYRAKKPRYWISPR
jgi:hypothetical protein